MIGPSFKINNFIAFSQIKLNIRNKCCFALIYLDRQWTYYMGLFYSIHWHLWLTRFLLNLIEIMKLCIIQISCSVLCHIKVNSTRIELTVRTSCYCIQTYSVLILIKFGYLMHLFPHSFFLIILFLVTNFDCLFIYIILPDTLNLNIFNSTATPILLQIKATFNLYQK